VNPHAQATNGWFEWGLDNTLATPALTTQLAVGAGSSDNTVSTAITGLTFGTTYYYRAVGLNASGTTKGAIVSFSTGTPNSAPTVTTDSSSSVTLSGAVLNGSVNPNELASTSVFEWGTDPTLATYGTTSPAHNVGAGGTSVAVSDPLSGLTPGTTYYYRVSAQNTIGISKGTIRSFVTIAQPPTVVTNAATSISITGATLNGTVNPNGLLVSNAHFEYGTSPTLATSASTAIQSAGSGFAGQGITASLPGLTPGTTYYFRVAASNSAGSSTGSIVTFTTDSQPPTVATASADNLSATAATLHGTVNPNGLTVSNAHFEYGTDQNLVGASSTANQSVGSGLTDQPVSAYLPGLTAGTTYYFRVVAGNSVDTSSGLILSFTLPLLPPTATTSTPTSVTSGSCVLNGFVNPNGLTTVAHFEYGEDPSLTAFTSTGILPVGSGSTNVPLNASIGSLFPGRSYYFRLVATNGGGTQRGGIRNFLTGPTYVAVGDSITAGSHDDNPFDGIGYEPILGNLLGAMIATKGVSGATSEDGALTISSTLAEFPTANHYLVLYGTNDANSANGAGYPIPKATYKANVQAIITTIKNAGKIPYLAKIPFATAAGFSNASIQEYNAAIDELRSSNGISVVAPDYYTWFQSHTGQLSDGLHPNGTGYQSMANLWFNELP
jgi:lysophospholipase L1-like esterase/phosphodiesterase/alkaline phosphatase D-like protein